MIETTIEFDEKKHKEIISYFKELVGAHIKIVFEEYDTNAPHKANGWCFYEGILIEVTTPSWYNPDLEDPFYNEMLSVYLKLLKEDGSPVKFEIDNYYTDQVIINVL